MIIDQQKNTIETSVQNKAAVFTIENNAKMFEALSKNLYEDSILAIVREISCNAYDAHVEANRLDVKFNVNFPNHFNPYFEVKDYGNGLTELEILGDVDKGISGLYNSYFKSSKNNTDKQIGGWGLGSKSPFAYTNQFNIESRQNGICKFYNCFKNEENKPSVVKMGEGPTEEKDGLTVKIPVKPNDFYNFQDSGVKVFQFWENKPTFTGKQLHFIEVNYDIKEKNFGITKNNNDNAKIIVNNIDYKIDSSFFNFTNLFTHNYYSLLKRIVLFANVSDVNVTLSRDNLEYTDKTKKFINDCFKEIETFLLKNFEEKIQECKTLNEAFVFHDKYPFKFPSFNFNGILYKMESINIKYGIVDRDLFHFSSYSNKVQKENKYGRAILNGHYFKCPVIKVDDKIYKEKITKFLKDKNIENCYLIFDDSLDQVLKDYFGEILLSSSLPKIPKEPKIKVKKDKNKCCIYQKGYYKDSCFQEAEVDITTTKALYLLQSNKIKDIKGWDNVRDILCSVYDITKLDIYKFPKNTEKKLINNGWVSVEDKITEILSKITHDKTNAYYSKALNKYYESYTETLVKNINKFSGKLKDFLEEYKIVSTFKSKLSDDEENLFYKFNGKDSYKFKNEINLDKEYHGISRFSYDDKIVDYILMIDKWRSDGKIW